MGTVAPRLIPAKNSTSPPSVLTAKRPVSVKATLEIPFVVMGAGAQEPELAKVVVVGKVVLVVVDATTVVPAELPGEESDVEQAPANRTNEERTRAAFFRTHRNRPRSGSLEGFTFGPI